MSSPPMSSAERSRVFSTEPVPDEDVPDLDGDVQPTRPLAIVARRRLGETGLAVHPVACGTSSFGWTTSQADAYSVLDRFRTLGGNLIDTADSYAGGESESIIGGWLSKHGARESVVLSTKVGKSAENPGLSPVSIVRAVDASLRRLQTDHIDVLSFHVDDREIPLEDSLATVEWLMDAGKVRTLGAVGFSPDRLLEARILSSTGLPKILVVGSHYSVTHRAEYESGVQLAVSAQSLAVLPCSDLGTRFALDRGRTETGPLAVIARATDQFARRGGRILAALDRVAGEHEVNPAAIAVAWLLTKRNVVAPVVGFATPAEVEIVMTAAGLRLTRAQVRELDRVSS